LLVAVHVKNADGGASDSGLTDEMNSVPLEMSFPSLKAGVEERNDRIGDWIDAGEIGTFVEIALVFGGWFFERCRAGFSN
jgi:hypothetical protein